VPKDAKASVSLRVSNGGISTSGLDMAVSEQSRRRVDGTIGGGGSEHQARDPPTELSHSRESDSALVNDGH
jgi:hypothetical protein